MSLRQYLSNAQLIAQTIQWHEKGLNFADAFHLANSQDCREFYTFDDKFVKIAQGLTKCIVNKL